MMGSLHLCAILQVLAFTMMGITTPVCYIAGARLYYDGDHYTCVLYCRCSPQVRWRSLHLCATWQVLFLTMMGITTPVCSIAGAGLYYDGDHRERRVGVEIRQHGAASVCLHARLLQQRVRELPDLQQDHHRRHDRPHH